MDKPSTSKATKDTEVLDLSKSSVSNSTAIGTEVSDLTKSPVSNRPKRWRKIYEYFLIKHDPIHVARQSSYRLINYMDIVGKNGIYVYNSKLRYYDDGAYITGSVVAASPDVSFLERLVHKWTVEYPPNAHLLVQYRPTPNRLEHKVMHESEVVHITALSDIEAEHQDVFVPDGGELCQACVLTCNVIKGEVMVELAKVKSIISASLGCTYMRTEDLDEDAATIPEGNPWLLIQHSADLMKCSHTIMRYEDTLHRELNPYPCYQVIMKNKGKLQHGLILYKSHNFQEVCFALHNIINSNVISMYPHFNDMSLRQESLKKTMYSFDGNGKLVYDEYVCCLESRAIPASNDESYQHPDLYTTGTGVVGGIYAEDLEIGNQVANYVGAEASAMNKLCDKIKGAEENMATTLKELENLNKNDS